ncbi:glycosyltransferase family 2 protein [Desulfoplanes formicivorans]|uniref:Glycosyl transferase n=1 Tax=Desulfoplanes formicivorans TaxID=1592317 RepID=A0A194AK79_9BACT|nr:glycosyltransferase family 2 protein [Desulfoplanes formicivorans]GAU09124.1 glycosyl transferase [Desulfoplanes formicivorans]
MKISVITVSYNSQCVIVRCICSVLAQNKPFEYIVIDGNSTDKTPCIVKKYQNHIDTFISEEDDGIYDAMNKGIHEAQGEIIGFINSDDFYHDSRVFQNVYAAFQETGCDSCYGDLIYVDTRYRPVRHWKSGAFRRNKLYWGWMPPHPTFFVKKSIFDRYGGFDASFGTAADYELMVRFLVRHRISCTYIPKVLVCMQTGGASNVSLKARLAANQSDMAAWEKNGLHSCTYTTFCKPMRKLYQFSTLLRSSSNV